MCNTSISKNFSIKSLFLVFMLLSSTFSHAITFMTLPSIQRSGNFMLSWANAIGSIEITEEINGVSRVIHTANTASGNIIVIGRQTVTPKYFIRELRPGGEVKQMNAIFGYSTPFIQTPKSIFINNHEILNAQDFSLLRVLNQLAAQMTANNPTDPIDGTTLFARMWDAQNPVSQSAGTGIANCSGSLNNFAVECRPEEGIQATQAANYIAGYIPIALANRFDLRDKETFQDCGEYRIVFGRPSGGRNFISLDAVLPNPLPGNAAGCYPLQEFFRSLSSSNNAGVAQFLNIFYFKGIPDFGIRAPIDYRNFAQGSGQIRTNQFLGSSTWNLKEYKTAVENGKNTLQVVSVKNNPNSLFFQDGNADSRAIAFKNDFVNNLQTLTGDVNQFSLKIVSDTHNLPQSHASGAIAESDYSSPVNFVPGGIFSTTINTKLIQLGSTLTPLQITKRATAMSCAGCHNPSAFGLNNANALGTGVSWPNSHGFNHISEYLLNGEYPLSPALINQFLPARKIDLENYLQTKGVGVQPVNLPKRSG